MYRLALVLRGLWWRRGLTISVFVVAAITTMAAALGPLYARAAGESTLRDQLAGAPVTATGVHFHTTADVSTKLGFTSVLQEAPQPGRIAGYPTRIAGIYATTTADGTGADGTGATVLTGALWRQGICQHVVIVSGRCPSVPGQVLVSQRTVAARSYGWRLGGTIRLPGLRVAATDADGFPIAKPARATIVGTYRPRNTADPYWFGQDYFQEHANAKGPDTVDAVIVAQSEFTSLTPPQNAEVDVDLPIDVTAVHWKEVPALQRGVDRLTAQYFGEDGEYAQTGIDKLIAEARHQRALVGTGTMLVTVQLGLLAWLVLFQVVSDAAEARGNEIALSKLRGRGALATLRFGLSEPLVLLLAAIPFGLLLALLVGHVFAATVLVAGTPVVMPAGAVFAALVAFAGGLVAALVAGQRTLGRSALEQWQRSATRSRRSRVALLADVLLAAAAAAALVGLRAHHRAGTGNDPAALLAPGLLVTAVALLGVRVLPAVCAALAPATRGSRRFGLFIGLRQVGRRPAGLRLAALLAIALGLSSFAVAGESVAYANRTVRAQGELGAARVLSIQYDSGHNPIAAVQHADPDGRWAMAAATWLPDGGDSAAGTVLGVDGSRLARVGYSAAGGPSVSMIAATIAASAAPMITVTATRLRVHLTATGLTPGPAPDVQLNLSTPQQAFLNVLAGALRDGTHVYTADLSCAAGCIFHGITWDRAFNATGKQQGTVTVTGIDTGDGATWTPLNARLAQSSAWRAAVPQGIATDSLHATPDGLVDDFTNDFGGYGGITYAYAPSPMPAVATPPAIVTGSGAPKVPQLVDNTQTVATFQVRQYARVLPAVLTDGVILDVRYLDAELPDFAGEANWQVWLGPHAPADAVARLRSAGLIVQSSRSERARVHTLGREGPALALLLLLACAIAGTVLAIGATAISVSASSRRRSYELAALRAVGVSRRSLLHAGIVEQLLLLGTAVVIGVPSGLVAARLAMPAIPEFSASTPITLHYAPQMLPIVLSSCAFVVLLTGTAVIAARSLISVAVPARLREPEQ